VDSVITAVAQRERQKAYEHLYQKLLIPWRKELWPDRSKDPIWLEEHSVRHWAHVKRLHQIHPILEEYNGNWSVM
jgi:hypothetical protein